MKPIDIKIIPFSEEYQSLFTSLNKSWVEKYFILEPADREMLLHPKENIIDKGGHIYFAKNDDNIIGTFALIPIGNKIYELSKMAVDESYRGRRTGNKMLEFCLEEAKRLKANKIILFSNTLLQPAIHLYKKYGFKEVPLGNSEYKRSNIKMEINL